MMRGLRLWSEVLLLLLSLGHSQYEGVDLTPEEMEFFRLKNQTRILDNCYYVDHEYYPPLQGESCTQNSTLALCQSGCQASPQCSFFTYWKNTQRCCQSGTNSHWKWSPGSTALSGPKICTKVRSGCAEMPGDRFPGASQEASEEAWPSRRVPNKLECWPKDWAAGNFQACDKIEVVEDSEGIFPGKCTGLTQIPVVPQFESCQSLCKKEPFCSVFQTSRSGGVYGPKTCWHGYTTPGINCYENRDANFIPIRAQRFVQGEVRVLANTTGVQIMGLYKVFDPYFFINVTDLIHACKITCYSHLLCQYWQYYELSGCWMEVPAVNGAVQYPPTTEAWRATNVYSDTILAGEYIQHVCDAARGTVVKATVAPKPIKPTPFAGEPLYGALRITGIKYANLSAADRATLRVLYAENIAQVLGVANESVLDLADDPKSVTLYPGLYVKFKVETHTGLTQEDVIDKLALNDVHIQLKDVTINALGLRGTASASNITVIESEESQKLKKGLPWYCGLFLLLMIGACVGAGLVGYVTSQEEEDDLSNYGSDGGNSPARSTGEFSPLRKVLVEEQAPVVHGKGTGKGDPGLLPHPGGIGSGSAGFGAAAREVAFRAEDAFHRAEEHVRGGIASGSSAAREVAYRAEDSFHRAEEHVRGDIGSGGARMNSAARDVAIRAEGAFHRAEERFQGMLANAPGQAGVQGPVGPSRDQLMQYAHQGR